MSPIWPLLLCLCFLVRALSTSNSIKVNEKRIIQCPVCLRVLRAVRSLAKGESSQSSSTSQALQKYCELSSLSVEEAKFCYDISSIHQELARLFILGAEDERICRRVFAKNPDFCMMMADVESVAVKIEGGSDTVRLSRGTRDQIDKIHSESGTRRKGVIFM